MDRQALFVLSLIITLIFFFIQRADPSRKKAVEYFGWFIGMLVSWFMCGGIVRCGRLCWGY